MDQDYLTMYILNIKLINRIVVPFLKLKRYYNKTAYIVELRAEVYNLHIVVFEDQVEIIRRLLKQNKYPFIIAKLKNYNEKKLRYIYVAKEIVEPSFDVLTELLSNCEYSIYRVKSVLRFGLFDLYEEKKERYILYLNQKPVVAIDKEFINYCFLFANKETVNQIMKLVRENKSVKVAVIGELINRKYDELLNYLAVPLPEELTIIT